MELTAKQQTVELIKASENILLLTHQNPDGDALGSILALQMVLMKLGKKPIAVVPDTLPSVYKFLPATDCLKSEFSGTKDFVITVNTSKTKLDKLGYKNIPEENKLNIIITPTAGSFSVEDLSFNHGAFKYDLIFVLDAPDLERLGPIYDKNTELFYEVPVINIDHHAGNDYFGKVNWVDLTATSTAEILVALVESLGRDKPLIDIDVATALLTGIIVDTGSFQHANTTPKSFTVAAQLVAAGAKQQEIIRHVFKTKSLSTLKLWGHILSNVVEVPEAKFVWSKILKEDFVASGAEEAASSGIIDELLKTAPGIDFAFLLSEKMDGVHGSFRAAQAGIDVAAIAALFGGGGHQAAAAFHIPGKKLIDTQADIIQKITEYQKSKIG